jgi:hypothetical protein
MVKLVFCVRRRPEPSSTTEGIAAGVELLEDERKFIDLANSPLWLAEEHEIVAAGS